MQTKHLCGLIHIWAKGEVGAPWIGLSPPVKYFYWPVQGGALLWIVCVNYVVCLSSFRALWSPEGKGVTSWLLFVMFIVNLLLSHSVSWDRCGTWLYRFLVLAVFLTLRRFFWVPTIYMFWLKIGKLFFVTHQRETNFYISPSHK